MSEISMMYEELYKVGMPIRREVLGDEYVDKSLASAEQDELRQALQQAVTALGWGATWSRQGLDLKTRSLITVAMLIALNRPRELETHLCGALNNGVTDEELRELLLHAGCYCGWPAASDAVRVASDVLATHVRPPRSHS
ncbi:MULTISPECIES: carboxymuconolactone decarboxylase family protein [unclassified Shinella]|uniref:carboxymuconolactone decarboxylase family protein n=1 Tax=unclassified Shinella TaxID=2643062 RepID=UPI00225DCD75|nr:MULTISPECIES: carboxymuconolactone decarboxylase family protein [unclassified Shinella]CAI0334245.1 4-carboxymuconolactone decarboxylase [Rhizobiaceae bacterium]